MRACIWLQGCTLACPGCFNPDTHQPDVGTLVPTGEVLDWLREALPSIEGVTISGGEPLQQWEGLKELLDALQDYTTLSVLLFSGFSMHEISRMGRLEYLRSHVDVLLAGRFEVDKRIAKGLIGSANKTALFASNRYTDEDLRDIPVAEVFIDSVGDVVLTGIDPIRW